MVFLVIVVSCLFACTALAIEKEMTVNIEAGREDCYYQEIKEGDVIDFDYQVIDGGHGDLDITFRIADPTGRILVADFKKPENSHRLEAAMTGDYKFCFDNVYSSYNTKTVFFGLLLDEDENDSDETVDIKQIDSRTFDYKIEDIQGTLGVVKSHLIKTRHLQEVIKSFEARDTNIAEENNCKVVMLKSLFDVDSKVQKLWKRIDSK